MKYDNVNITTYNKLKSVCVNSFNNFTMFSVQAAAVHIKIKICETRELLKWMIRSTIPSSSHGCFCRPSVV